MCFIRSVITISFYFVALMTSAAPLTFKQALNFAYANNPELLAEIDKAQAMRGSFVQSGLYPNPQLSLTGENLGGSGSYAGYESAETTLSVNQPIPLGSRLKFLQKATYADYMASLAQIKVQKAALYVAVGSTYIDALYAGQWHKVTKKLIQLNQNIVSAIQRRVKAGAGQELDLHLAQLRLGEARIQEKRAKREYLVQRAKLARLIGAQVEMSRPLIDKGLPGLELNWFKISKNISQSPQLLQIQLQLQAKRATITAVKKSVWPDLNILVGGRHFSDDGSNAAVLSTSAEVPITNRNQGKIIAAESEYSQIAHELKGVHLEVKQNAYAIFLQAKQSQYEANLVTNSLLPSARRSIKLAQEGYQMGRYTYLELSTAMSALYEEERHYYQAHADYHSALIQLVGLLGINPIKESP